MIPYGKHHIDEEDVRAVVDVLRGGVLTQGPYVEAFEKAVAEYVGAKYAVAVSSGTAGLHLAALVAGVGTGKSLITSPITFIASANAGLYAGGDVFFADIDSETINMSPLSLKKALEDRPCSKAVVPVHFAGLPCDMPAIKSLSDAAGATLIEDAAHALGSTYTNGRRVGCCEFSSMTVFSFHPVKLIAAGEGGMITTNDEVIYRKLLRLRSHGINKLDDPFQLTDQSKTNGLINPWYYEMQDLGFHYRITDIQSALALSQIKKIDKFLDKRLELACKYDRGFTGMKNCRPFQSLQRSQSAHHLYILQIDFDSIAFSRVELMQHLKLRNIGTQVHYLPVPAHPYYRRLGHIPENYPSAQKYYQEALSIPLFYDLNDEQQCGVISAFEELVG